MPNRQLLDFKIKQNTLNHNLNKIDTELTSNTKVSPLLHQIYY